jgi:hypothetical protein
MAYTAHRRIARDSNENLLRRASSARSCALHVAEKLRVPRSVVIRVVLERTGSDLKQPGSAEAILTAIEFLELLRMGKAQLTAEATGESNA